MLLYMGRRGKHSYKHRLLVQQKLLHFVDAFHQYVMDSRWTRIASRIKNMLGLALDFYSIEQTLGSGGATPASRARCKIELDRIEKQFDDCIAFLLRILSFKLNVGLFHIWQIWLLESITITSTCPTAETCKRYPDLIIALPRAGRATASKTE